jgi:hypothetical protein
MVFYDSQCKQVATFSLNSINQLIDVTEKCLFEANSHHPNVVTFRLFLSEGRAGVAWEPSNTFMHFLPSPK